MLATADSSVPSRLKLSAKFVVTFLVAVLVLSTLAPIVRKRSGGPVVYTKAAIRLANREQFYRPEEGKAFTYPPFFALAFVPLAPLSEYVRRTFWYFINFTALGAILYLVVRQAWPVVRGDAGRTGPSLWVLCLVVAVLSTRFVISPLEHESHDLIVFLLVALAISAWGAGAERLTGLYAGLGAAFKGTPLLFLPVFLTKRQFGAIVTCILAAVGATLLPDLIFPRLDGGLWVVSWYENFVSKVGVGAPADAPGAWASWNALNQSLAGTLYRLSTPPSESTGLVFDARLWHPSPTTLKVVTTVAQLVIVAFLIFVTWPSHSRDLSERELPFHRLGEGAAVLCAILLLSPMSSTQHFSMLFVPITFCAVHFLYRQRDTVVGGALLVVLLSGSLGGKDLVGQQLFVRLLAYGSLTISTLACLAATGHVLVRYPRAGRKRIPNSPTCTEDTE